MTERSRRTGQRRAKLDIHRVIAALVTACAQLRDPVVTEMSNLSRDPYQVLIATLLSLRTKDEHTRVAARRLFSIASNPEDMVQLSPKTIETAIFPVGFYRVKARNVIAVSRILLERYGARVPDEIDELLKLPGVGRKTANLVVTLGFGLPGICVDTHVHRISNRLGYVRTKVPEETEMALRKKLPRQYWIQYNDLLVAFGQNVCVPISPWCSRCPLAKWCARVGVERSR